MENQYTSLKHAQHNSAICRHLFHTKQYNDWVITTAFYSAVHYLCHFIFPFNVQKSGSNVLVNCFEDYCLEKNIRGKRHGEMRKLVESNCDIHIAAMYNQMLDLSWTARYSKYSFSEKASATAQKRLDAIEKYAQSK